MMRHNIGSGFAALTLAAAAVAMAAAQSAPAQRGGAQTQTRSENERSVTGCVQRGQSASQFQLTARDGTRWNLESESVQIGPHVGHTVTITGEVTAQPRSPQPGATTAAAAQPGRMNVTRLTMVSPSCQDAGGQSGGQAPSGNRAPY